MEIRARLIHPLSAAKKVKFFTKNLAVRFSLAKNCAPGCKTVRVIRADGVVAPKKD